MYMAWYRVGTIMFSISDVSSNTECLTYMNQMESLSFNMLWATFVTKTFKATLFM